MCQPNLNIIHTLLLRQRINLLAEKSNNGIHQPCAEKVAMKFTSHEQKKVATKFTNHVQKKVATKFTRHVQKKVATEFTSHVQKKVMWIDCKAF